MSVAAARSLVPPLADIAGLAHARCSWSDSLFVGRPWLRRSFATRVRGDSGLVPPTVPEFESHPNGNVIWQSPVASPIPADLHRMNGPLPEDLAQSEDAVYARAEWVYVFRVRNRGSRSAILVGRLYHHENALIGRVGQVLETPWGRFRRLPFFGYEQGWLPADELARTDAAADP